MSRTTKDRLLEILNAITAVRSHLNYGGLEDLLVWDAVCMRLFQIGEVATWQFRSFADLENASY